MSSLKARLSHPRLDRKMKMRRTTSRGLIAPQTIPHDDTRNDRYIEDCRAIAARA